jgi:hypothetical protein
MSTEYDKVKAAADGGDRRAQGALQALAQAAADADAAALPDTGERGLAEARRRYGPQVTPDTATGTGEPTENKGLAELRRRYGSQPGDAA